MHEWTDSTGEKHLIPVIDWPVCVRLKRWGVVDLMAVLNDHDRWSELFERIESDAEFVCNVIYALECQEVGTEEQQMKFGMLLVSDGSGPLLEAMGALRDAVIDFFPADLRDAIRDLLMMETARKNLKTLQKVSSSEVSGSAIHGSGSSGSSESSKATDAESRFVKSVNDTTASSTTT